MPIDGYGPSGPGHLPGLNVASRSRQPWLARLSTIFVASALWMGVAWPAAAQGTNDGHWVSTWGPSMIARGVPGGRGQAPPQPAPGRGRGGAPPFTFNNQTLRQVARVTIGGARVRVLISNTFGTAPLRVGAARAALRACAESACEGAGGAAIETPAVPLTVSGRAAFTIPAGAALLTDPVDLKIPDRSDVVVDLYLPEDWSANTVPLTFHPVSLQTTYVSTPGNFAGARELPVDATPANWFFLSRIEVIAPRDTRVIVALGDSITDGAQSTIGANRRWTDVLARRLHAEPDGRPAAVINAGISGNRLLTDGSGVSALARFDRDVLAQPGLTHLILFEGINDIGLARASATPTVEDLIMAQRQLIARARARGVRVVGATLAPIEGAFYFTPEGESKRQAFNAWIRTSGEFDGVIDFDRITRDPDRPTWLLPANDSGDHLHPGDAGYAAMGSGIDLALFR